MCEQFKLFLAVCALMLILSVASNSEAASIISNEYDSHFKSAAVFLPKNTDWRLLKAQCYQESRLKPFAKSPVGASGLCQFMPNTWKDLNKKYPELNNIWLPEQSILAAAIYMNQLSRVWKAPRPELDRYKLCLASYNAGAGHLIKAQKLANNSNLYDPVINQLPKVTGKHSKETSTYVHNIVYKWWILLLVD